MSIKILQGDVRDMLKTLPDESVHCVVTSPPYWGLRDYGVPGQLGIEPTMGEHIDTMVEVFREVRRVLRKDGTVWLNYGSSYISGDMRSNQSHPSENAPACGSDDKEPSDSRGLDCACPGPCDVHQAGFQSRHADSSHNGRQTEQSPPPAGRTAHDSEHSDSSGASPAASPQSALASNTGASSQRAQDASGPSAMALASRIDGLTFSDDAQASARKDGDTIDIAEIQRLLVAHNWDKEPLALACLYLSITARRWKAKDLANVPNLIAEALQCDGWWVRSEIIWHKPNPMPESVTDRPATAHEKIWLLSKSARYYYDAEAVRRPIAPGSIDRYAQDIDGQEGSHWANGGAKTNGTMKAVGGPRKDKQRGHSRRHAGFNDRWDLMPKDEQIANGANLRNVWTVPTNKGFSGAHYATFPPDLIVPCIKAGCPKGGIVLDPFIGSGTTAMVADRLGRDCIGIDLNPANVTMATDRIRDDAGMFADVS